MDEAAQKMSAIIYANPMAVDSEEHQGYKLQAVSEVGFDFADHATAVYVTAIEFAEASKEYPLIFVRDNDTFTAMVALSVDGKTNAFVADSQWDARYVPAFVRRYPFIPGLPSDASKTGEKRFTLLIDEAYSGFGKNVEGVELFDGEKPSAELQQITDFVKNYHIETIKTNTFVKALLDLGLLVDKRLQVTFPDGSTQYSIAGTWVVDEQKLKNLDGKTIEDLHRRGYLYLIYLHLASLRNFSYLAELQSAKA